MLLLALEVFLRSYHHAFLHRLTIVRTTCEFCENAISSVLPLTLLPFPRRAIIQHDNHVISSMSLCPYPSQPLANCVCVCLLPRLHPGLHHAICIPGREEDGAQTGLASIRPPLHPGEQWRGVLRPRPEAPGQPAVWHDGQRLLQW